MTAQTKREARLRRRETELPQGMPAAVLVVLFVLVGSLGYVIGIFNTQLFDFVAPYFGVKTSTGQLDLSSVQKTYRELKANYDGELDDSKLIEGANRGLVDAVGDEYTTYMNFEESTAFENDLSGNIGGGVGVELGQRNGRIVVLRVLKDNPAEAAGLRADDVVMKINGQTAENLTVSEAVSRVRGEVGTTVKLTILRGSTMREFTITRATINNPSVYSSIRDDIGIMTMTRFDSETGNLAREIAREFKQANVKGVVLDLRGNSGGYVSAAQQVAGVWLDNRLVVTEKSQGATVDELYSSRSPILDGIPTVVLVNGSSASASEIVAGALQDHGVAKLVGEKTYGKGSVQKLIALPDGAELKVTTARWYTPNGRNISQEGIVPTTVVSITQADIEAGRDPQLQAALNALR